MDRHLEHKKGAFKTYSIVHTLTATRSGGTLFDDCSKSHESTSVFRMCSPSNLNSLTVVSEGFPLASLTRPSTKNWPLLKKAWHRCLGEGVRSTVQPASVRTMNIHNYQVATSPQTVKLVRKV